MRLPRQDGEALFEVRERHHDLAVEAARTQQSRVQDVGPIGGGDDDDALGRVEPVHLREHLVERLLAFVVPAAEAGAPLAADRVDLVDEDDGRRLLAGRLEQVADPAGADADEHLHEVRAAHRQEGDACLTGHRPRQQRLARSGRAHEQHALGDLGPDVAEPPRGLQEVDDLADLLFDARIARHVTEGGGRPVGAEEPGPRPADRHDPRHLPSRLAAEEPQDPEEQEPDQKVGEDEGQEVGGRLGEVDLDAGLADRRDVVLQHGLGPLGGELGAAFQLTGDHARPAVEGRVRDLVVRGVLQELGVLERLGRRVLEDHRQDQHADDDEHDARPQPAEALLFARAAARIGAVVGTRGLVRPVRSCGTHPTMLGAGPRGLGTRVAKDLLNVGIS
jgi:hypothetical protein